MIVFHAIPLADHGFIPISESNRVRWYVGDDGGRFTIGPYSCREAAEDAAIKANAR